MLKNVESCFGKIKNYLFPIILILYPFVGVTEGLDISDTTYSMVNYQFMGNIDSMWILSTFLSNVFGKLIMHLPFAGTMPGFGAYCSILISILAIIAYFELQRYMPDWIAFIGLFMAESLYWCPRVILYNNLTYFFFTIGALLLLKGTLAEEKQGLLLFMAGIFLGLNVMVRFPNVVECGLILVLWFYHVISGHKIPAIAVNTLICILGYVTGIGVVYIIISFVYGTNAYFDMIASLFGMTSTASDYSSGGMLSLIAEAYLGSVKNMIIMIPCAIAGMIMFKVKPGKYLMVKRICYVAGLLVLVRFYFARGVFTRNYYYYDSIFKAAMMFLIITIVLCVIAVTGFLGSGKKDRTLALCALLIILITPLGSNNYTYPVINNLFIVAPVSIMLVFKMIKRLGTDEYHFAWQGMVAMVFAVLICQGILFHFNFAFGDGDDGTKRDTAMTQIRKVSGMKTSENNAKTLLELNDALDTLATDTKENSKVLLFGGVPGLSYVFDLEPAIDTVWPDLDSYSTEKFENQLTKLSCSDDPEPLIIIGKDMRDYSNIALKYDILLDYINNHDYNKVFESDRFILYAKNNLESGE